MLHIKCLMSRFDSGVLPRYHYMMTVCLILGVVAGASTFILHAMLKFISSRVMEMMNPDSINYNFLWTPVLGVLLTVVYVKYIIRLPLEHGTARVKQFLIDKNYNLPPRLMWGSMIASSITLGFGGSAGAEGPSAYTGAAIGSNLGKLFHLTPEQMRLIVGIGAGAGIAGIFRSPLGGVFFTLEVLRMPLTTLPVMALIVAATAAGMTSYLMAGSQFDVIMTDGIAPQVSDIPFILILGLICGLYSVYYSYTLTTVGKKLERINNVWLRAVLSGGIIGLAIFIFPALYATGYGSLGDILNENLESMLRYSMWAGDSPSFGLLVMVALGIVVIKAFACSATNYGGGVAGNFAPTLFAGGFVGFIFATVLNHFFGLALHVPDYIYLGMAGAMAGIIRAPLMAMFLTAEMTGHQNFLWSLAIVSAISWLTARLIAPHRSV